MGALSEFLTRHVRSSRRQFSRGNVMDGISWSDLNEDEQSAIEMLAAGASADLCDPVALLTLTRIGLITGLRLTSSGEQLQKIALLHELAA